MKKNNPILENEDYKFLKKFFAFSKKQWKVLEAEQNAQAKTDEFFKYLIKAKGFDALPIIIKDEDYGSLNSQEYYRGAESFAHTAQLLTSKEYRPAKGYMGGYFASTDKLTAKKYTASPKEAYRQNNQKILSFKIASDSYTKKSNLEYYWDLVENGTSGLTTWDIKQKLAILNNFIATIPNINEQQRFYKLFKNDPSKLALYLGFDFVIDDNPPTNRVTKNDIVILNRSTMVVSKNEFDKFVSKANVQEKNSN